MIDLELQPHTVDPHFFIVISFSWVGGKMKIKNMKICNTIQNSGNIMHFLDQNLKKKKTVNN